AGGSFIGLFVFKQDITKLPGKSGNGCIVRRCKLFPYRQRLLEEIFGSGKIALLPIERAQAVGAVSKLGGIATVFQPCLGISLLQQHSFLCLFSPLVGGFCLV